MQNTSRSIREYRNRVILLQTVNLVNQATQYLELSKDTIPVTFSYSLAAMFECLTLLGICMVNIEVLKVYGLLSRDITVERVALLKQGIGLLYLVLCSWNTGVVVLYAICPDWLITVATQGTLYWAAFASLYDNLQALGLTFLVSSWMRIHTKQKEKHATVLQITRNFFRIILVTVAIALLDVVGLFLYAEAVNNSRLEQYFRIGRISSGITGIHAVAMTFVFFGLKEMLVVHDKEAKILRRQTHKRAEIESPQVIEFVENKAPTTQVSEHFRQETTHLEMEEERPSPEGIEPVSGNLTLDK
ncbi:hypothetical protein HDU91_002822 [Kappamyces sp. JEL0680]|nr:hypothetical protein HDU91_002822 [Kappamyces sp. JEL0680]